jgi:hypothetical protein
MTEEKIIVKITVKSTNTPEEMLGMKVFSSNIIKPCERYTSYDISPRKFIALFPNVRCDDNVKSNMIITNPNTIFNRYSP